MKTDIPKQARPVCPYTNRCDLVRINLDKEEIVTCLNCNRKIKIWKRLK